mmetsp:Transcript_14502/g.57841  ORF Transcript_14502/g.57841 Transcript_14502/m.57841 type:complete len:204 (-) Transcript_14502:717-1328(-)
MVVVEGGGETDVDGGREKPWYARSTRGPRLSSRARGEAASTSSSKSRFASCCVAVGGTVRAALSGTASADGRRSLVVCLAASLARRSRRNASNGGSPMTSCSPHAGSVANHVVFSRNEPSAPSLDPGVFAKSASIASLASASKFLIAFQRGCARTMFENVCRVVSAWNGGMPAHISYTRHPSAQQSTAAVYLVDDFKKSSGAA